MTNDAVEAPLSAAPEASSDETPAAKTAPHSPDRPAAEQATREDPWAEEQDSESRSVKTTKEAPQVKQTDQASEKTSPSETPKAPPWKDPFAE
jgi:hypothetical protein